MRSHSPPKSKHLVQFVMGTTKVSAPTPTLNIPWGCVLPGDDIRSSRYQSCIGCRNAALTASVYKHFIVLSTPMCTVSYAMTMYHVPKKLGFTFMAPMNLYASSLFKCNIRVISICTQASWSSGRAWISSRSWPTPKAIPTQDVCKRFKVSWNCKRVYILKCSEAVWPVVSVSCVGASHDFWAHIN